MSEVAPAIDTPLNAAETTPKERQRLDFIDALRGLILCLMVLDHTREFFHIGAYQFDPLDLDKTSLIVYFTRWITHLCAPTFVFLSGVSICLQKDHGKTGWTLSRFLLTRGLWLVVLELTVLDFGWNFAAPFVFLQVFWAIGVSMMIMAALVWLPRNVVLALGVIIVAGHNLLDGVDAQGLSGGAQVFWRLMMQPGGLGAVPGFNVYPAIPWLGIMCLGYGVTPLLARRENRTRNILLLASAMLCLFAVLRGLNLYGNGRLWQTPTNPALTLLAIIDVTKYPPSLDYALVTLGIALLLALGLERLPASLLKPFLAFGRTPLFTYLFHLYILHTLAIVIGVMRGVPPQDFVNFLPNSGPGGTLAQAHWGLPLWATYLSWLSVLVVLYPLSSWYAAYRSRHRYWWTSYL